MNHRRKLLWQFAPFYVALFLLTFVVILLTASITSENSWFDIRILSLATAGGIVTASLGVAVIWHISQAIEKTREGARRFASGDLGFRMELPPSDELGSLSETLNAMAEQLDARITTINAQRAAQATILGSMVEGLIAIDSKQSILQLNRAASQLLGVKSENAVGRNIFEIARNRELNNLIERTLGDRTPSEGEVTLYGSSERSLQVHCTPLHMLPATDVGALIVLNDITRLRRLERVRRDFVANVSHELKTPLTSIKGFVETLQEGALKEPEEAERFCAIIAKQVDRLQAIIEDLLSLSRIEQDAEMNQMPIQHHPVKETLLSAVQLCSKHAAEKNIAISVECEDKWQACFNAPLLEQVMVNLIDNAIKYSDPEKSVELSVAPGDNAWIITVKDHGCGIEFAHQKRIFERFYRVDKARSRKVGGTGLGLSIVKHIVSAHGGNVTVDSKPGEGSVFTVELPRHSSDVC
ncbi:MAG TPA: ATP-binding protein [Kiritimatiellia bacterium]|nr:ATP-binding protein [Kiritimatiellia bacterium]